MAGSIEEAEEPGSIQEAEESFSVSIKKKKERESWLIEIVREEDAPQTGLKPPIQIVPDALRNVETNETCFEPKVVSLGPYHIGIRDYGLKGTKGMDRHKEDAVRWFVSLFPYPANANSEDKVMKIYDDFVTETSRDLPLRDWYANEFVTIGQLEDEEITFMMFVDGCFILHFVYLAVKKPNDFVRYPFLYQPVIVSDMFLLENQIPYVVLKSLMSLMPDPNTLTKQDIENFIQRWFLPEHGTWSSICDKRGDPCNPPTTSNYDDKEPFHLLDILRTKLIGSDHVDEFPPDAAGYYFRSIMELKAAGIKLYKSHSSNLNKIEFNQGLIGGSLSLPRIIIDDKTKTRLLNLIAYEMCPGRRVGVITSYIFFLGSLIYRAEDVKELRSRGILLNRLGNDEEVVKLFKEMTINLVADPRIYADALHKIQLHCVSRLKVRSGEMLSTYFSSPWTAISLVAAFLLLFLTVVQTIFTVWS